MKVSILTVTYNSSETLEDCFRSIHNQGHPHIEHIIIDGGSTDGTVEIVKKHNDKIARWISEPDRGLYDAMNKGIKAADGDIIGILNSDDIYADNSVIENVARTITENNVDSCYGDLVYVERKDTAKIKRQWKAGGYEKEKFKKGWMPPHPTFFCKKSVYEKLGLLNLDFPLAADYELMLRFLYKHRVSTAYIPKVLVKMRNGGTSRSGLYTVKAIRENYKAWKINGLNPSLLTFLLKPLSKITQFTVGR